jgi:transcriptional regulator with XRE-family HTH domain
MATFGQQLRATLRVLGKTPGDLADSSGATPQLVNRWLNAENVELATLYRLAKGLGVSIESLVSGIDPDYDAMREPDRSGDRIAELLSRIPDDVRDQLWRLLLTIAKAQTRNGTCGDLRSDLRSVADTEDFIY